MPPRVEVAVGAVVRRGDEVLLIRRGRGTAVGQWSIPGGRVEFGEGLKAAVAREVQEETSLEVKVGRFLGWAERMGDDPAPYHYVILDFAAKPLDPAAPPRVPRHIFQLTECPVIYRFTVSFQRNS